MDRHVELVVALADVYVATNHIRDLLENRLDALQRAFAAGATPAEVTKAMDGAEGRSQRYGDL